MDQTLNYFQQGMWISVMISAPPLLVAALCGVIVSLLQTVTQIQDQSVPYVIKLAAIVVTMLVCARWTCNELIQLINLAFALLPNVGR